MMQFRGDREVPLSSAEVWQRVSDVRFLIECVPDVESVTESEPDRAVCTIRPGLAFVRGTLELTVQVAERIPQSSVRLLLHTKGIGSSSDVEATITLTPQERGTHIHWLAELKKLGGLLKAVPQGLIQAAAQKVIADVWSAVERQMRDQV
ncbi:MAG TPA: carbon monoxide dehydrogenase subunit G [Gemmataceae bacterium]|nr:carbon monoxide dehydrogenase subunit G [Gemmataceae bacterium]